MSSENENFGPERQSEKCVICFDNITAKCHANTCLHRFCFPCLNKWATIRATCPLCQIPFNAIIVEPTFDYRSTDNELVEAQSQEESYPVLIVRTFIRTDEIIVRLLRTVPSTFENAVDVQGMRTTVYKQNMWSHLMPRSDTPLRFRLDNLCNLLDEFINRDIVVIRSLERQVPISYWTTEEITIFEQENDYITDLVMGLFPKFETRNLTTLLRPYLHEHAAHFSHELFIYISCLCNIDAYDRLVRHETQLPGDQFLNMSNDGIVDLEVEDRSIDIDQLDFQR